jgi:hypothetical protein
VEIRPVGAIETTGILDEEMTMSPLWLLKGKLTAPGWQTLEEDSKAKKIDLVVFDRECWALVSAKKGPTKYEGLVPAEPQDGLYVSEQGQPIYVVDRQEVRGPNELIKALGEEAEKKLEELGDPIVVLQKLGKTF